jgi:CheY-like chemotaxis protein
MPDHIPATSAPDALLPPRDKTHLLVVEDEPTIRELFAALLSAAGYSVAQAGDGFAALAEIRRRRPALILSDLNMPRMTGFELISVIRRRFPAIHIIAMSGAFAGDTIPSGVAADAYYQKAGRQIGTLVEVIETILAGKPLPDGGETGEQPGSENDPANPTQPAAASPHIALWVSRRGQAIEAPHIILTCLECLRSFPHKLEGESATMQLQQTPCVFCGSSISYALLDPNITHHPGYAPATPR